MTTVRFSDIPSKAEFTWDEEGSFSRWTLERTPNLQSDFTVKLQIKTHCGENGEEYDFEFLYKDLCYAVAKAYTKALKEHGFYGYHFSTYHEKVCVHQLLFLKAVALDCLEVRKLTNHSSGHGEVTKLADEMELLMFDM